MEMVRSKPREQTAAMEDALKNLYAESGFALVLALYSYNRALGCISTRIKMPTQIIQPYFFGADASKATCLWLKGLPLLQATGIVQPRLINGKQRWANQTDSGQNRVGPSVDTWAVRSITYPGIADAMAKQWGTQ